MAEPKYMTRKEFAGITLQGGEVTSKMRLELHHGVGIGLSTNPEAEPLHTATPGSEVTIRDSNNRSTTLFTIKGQDRNGQLAAFEEVRGNIMRDVQKAIKGKDAKALTDMGFTDKEAEESILKQATVELPGLKSTRSNDQRDPSAPPPPPFDPRELGGSHATSIVYTNKHAFGAGNGVGELIDKQQEQARKIDGAAATIKRLDVGLNDGNLETDIVKYKDRIDGVINADVFEKLKQSPELRDEIRKALDLNGDGIATLEEIRRAAAVMNSNNISAKDAEALATVLKPEPTPNAPQQNGGRGPR